MGSILNTVGESQSFLIVIELGGHNLGEAGTDLRGAPEAHQGNAPATATEGTFILLMFLGGPGFQGWQQNIYPNLPI